MFILLSQENLFDPHLEEFTLQLHFTSRRWSLKLLQSHGISQRNAYEDMKTALHGSLSMKSLCFLRSAKQIYELLLAWISFLPLVSFLKIDTQIIRVGYKNED